MPTALVTGASAGIGKALSEELARRGWRVALAARRKAVLEEVAGPIRSAGGEAMAVEMDVTDPASVKRGVDGVRSAWGAIDLAVANAGLSFTSPVSKLPLDKTDQLLRTNVLGAIYVVDAVVREMVERGSGHIVGIASLAGMRGLPGASVYSASKAALQTFLEAARVELAPKGVKVTVVNPGYIDTEMTAGREHPMPFLMSADEAAKLIVEAVEAGKRVYSFPLPMAALTRVGRLMPSALYDPLAWKFRGSRGKKEGTSD